ncbi:hypothetical protein PHLCEN_2v7320 [Hermanssonia centrifuga]|uniref:Uncharacterized protein n=1 Tax=Hermanssonia centrifuga TaxID=98765 RepID=A0A2R6NWV6_9APHY|nr:hypothetical protein PHLCEN_2v7320 [Hermanssonia centrifuga]
MLKNIIVDEDKGLPWPCLVVSADETPLFAKTKQVERSDSEAWASRDLSKFKSPVICVNCLNYVVRVANAGQPAIAGGQAIIAIENNFDCSKTITADELNFPAGSGYTVQLANPLNNTDVYAVSQEFEIKPLGAAYPASSATPTLESTTGSSSATSTGSGSGTSTSPTTSATGNSAAGLKGSAAGIAAIAAAAFGVILA